MWHVIDGLQYFNLDGSDKFNANGSVRNWEGWAEGPSTVPRQLGFWPERPKPKLPPLGRRLESWFGLG